MLSISYIVLVSASMSLSDVDAFELMDRQVVVSTHNGICRDNNPFPSIKAGEVSPDQVKRYIDGGGYLKAQSTAIRFINQKGCQAMSKYLAEHGVI